MNIPWLLDLAADCNLPPSSYLWEWNEYAEWQFRLASTHMKVRSNHRLLDVGCGAMRFGHLAVPWLDDDHYCGMDAFAPFVELGRRLMAGLGIEKRYGLECSDRFDFEIFDRQFDFAIAQSVLGHLSRAEVERCFQALRRVMVPGGKLYATVNFGGRARQRVGFLYGGIHPFRHTVLNDMQFYEDLCRRLDIGLTPTDIPHPAQKVVAFEFGGESRAALGVPASTGAQRELWRLLGSDETCDGALASTVTELSAFLAVPEGEVRRLVDKERFRRQGEGPRSQAEVTALFADRGFLVDNALNSVTRLRHPAKAEIRLAAVEKVLALGAGRVLDYGAGTGPLSLALAGRGVPDIVVAEVSDELCEFVDWRLRRRGHAGAAKWNLVTGAYAGPAVDAALIFDVFPVIEDPDEPIRRVAEVLAEGGTVVTNLEPIPTRSRERWSYLVGREPEAVVAAFAARGFELEERRPFDGDALYTFRMRRAAA